MGSSNAVLSSDSEIIDGHILTSHTFHRHGGSGLCTPSSTRVGATVLKLQIFDVKLEEAAILPHLVLPARSYRHPVFLPLNGHSEL